MKDKSKLFKNIDEHTYTSVYKGLVKLRKDNPAYRDDQLLMYMLCKLVHSTADVISQI